MTTALVMCARVDSDDLVLIKEGAIITCCSRCKARIYVSPSTIAVQQDMTVYLACNPCGREMAAASVLATGRMPEQLIAPGALNDDTPADRRRRNELEAWGFRYMTKEDL